MRNAGGAQKCSVLLCACVRGGRVGGGSSHCVWAEDVPTVGHGPSREGIMRRGKCILAVLLSTECRSRSDRRQCGPTKSHRLEPFET